MEVVALRQIEDARGAVLHMARPAAERLTPIGECYFSEVAVGAVKAWKRHREQAQRLAVPVGRIRLALYDDRAPDRAPIVRVAELGRPDAYCRVLIPPGIWYGFACISGSPALIANCPDRAHDPEESESRPSDAAGFPAVWDRPAAAP